MAPSTDQDFTPNHDFIFKYDLLPNNEGFL